VLTKETFMFGDLDVTENFALASQSKLRLGMMRREAKAPSLGRRRFRDRTFDLDRTGAASSIAATVDRTRDTRIKRKASAQENRAEIRPEETFHGLARKLNGGQLSSKSLIACLRDKTRSHGNRFRRLMSDTTQARNTAPPRCGAFDITPILGR